MGQALHKVKNPERDKDPIKGTSTPSNDPLDLKRSWSDLLTHNMLYFTFFKSFFEKGNDY